MAVTREGVIGNNGLLPWCYEAELDHFRKMTEGHIIVMGRKTFDTIPKSIFINRQAIVFSKNNNFNPMEAQLVNSIESFLEIIPKYFTPNINRNEIKKIFMIGGAQIANLFLDLGLIKSFILTEIHRNYSGDIYLEMNKLEGWKREEILKTESYTIVKLGI
jgi:dihydrofolate reductase